MKQKHIVFGRNASNTLGQIRSLGEAKLEPILIWIGEESKFLMSSKYVHEAYIFKTIDEGIDFMCEKFGGNEPKPVITIDSDGLVAEMNKQYSKLSKYFYFFNAGSDNRLTEMMEKEELCKLARKYGLQTPSSEIVNVGELPKTIGYPLLTKAADSFNAKWKSCVKICRKEEELLDFYKNVDVKQLLVQNFVEKKNEFVLQGIAINHGQDVYIPIEGSYYRIPDGYFGTLLYFNGITERGKSLIPSIKQMLKEIGYEGVFEVEFLIDKDDNYIFLEINFRYTLWNHTFTDMGLNFCKIWSEAITNGKFPTTQSISTEKRHILIHEFLDFLWYVKSGKINIFKWLSDFLKADSYVVWNKHDIKPFIQYVKRQIVKL